MTTAKLMATGLEERNLVSGKMVKVNRARTLATTMFGQELWEKDKSDDCVLQFRKMNTKPPKVDPRNATNMKLL